MTNFIVIGICVILLFAVVFVSIKPISMGIEARREKKDYSNDVNSEEKLNDDEDMTANSKLSDELKKLYSLSTMIASASKPILDIIFPSDLSPKSLGINNNVFKLLSE